MSQKFLYSDLTERIIGCFYQVYNSLGYGFLEKVYENSLAISLRKNGSIATPQYPIKVYFENEIVGNYIADLVVDDLVLVEIKSAESLADAHKAQLLNYLNATRFEVGLLLNFGPKPEFARKILTNDRKPHLSD